MREYEFHAAAAAELADAIDYYDAQEPGLGREFLSEVMHGISLIRRFPDAFSKVSPRSRRCRTRRFPYGVIYQVRGNNIAVIAVMNLRRRPDYWIDREQ